MTDAPVDATATEAWRRLDELSRRARRPATLSGPELDELVKLYQRVATHLSLVRTRSPDPALVDRLTDRAHIIETGTESFRFRRTLAGRRTLA